MLVDFDSEWFRLYSSAVLASDPAAAHRNVERALTCIGARLLVANGEERDALLAARRYLLMLDEIELPRAS